MNGYLPIMKISKIQHTSKYEGKSYYFAEFKNKIGFSKAFSGAKIPFTTEDGIDVNLCFPVAKPQKSDEVRYGLYSPFPFEYLNADLDDWGSINGYYNLEKPPFKEIRVKAIVVECNSENRYSVIPYLEKIISSVIAMHPDVVKDDEIDESDRFIKSFDKVGGQIEINLTSIIYEDTHYVSLSEFQFAISNLKNDLTIQYDLLSKAYRYSAIRDYRNALLSYATIIDCTLKQALYQAFNNSKFEKEAKNAISKANGYKSFQELMALLKVPIYRNKAIDSLMSLRNKVIHEGVKVSFNDIKDCRPVILEMLDFYKVQFFVNQIG